MRGRWPSASDWDATFPLRKGSVEDAGVRERDDDAVLLPTQVRKVAHVDLLEVAGMREKTQFSANCGIPL